MKRAILVILFCCTAFGEMTVLTMHTGRAQCEDIQRWYTGPCAQNVRVFISGATQQTKAFEVVLTYVDVNGKVRSATQIVRAQETEKDARAAVAWYLDDVHLKSVLVSALTPTDSHLTEY